MPDRYLAKDAVTLAGLLMPSCVERYLKRNVVGGLVGFCKNLNKEAVSNMGGIVHCDAGSNGQQHLVLE